MKIKYFVILPIIIFLWGCSSNKPIIDKTTNLKPIIENGILVQNLGYNVNTEFDEYSPSRTLNGKVLYFTSNRPNPSSSDAGDEDLWFSVLEDHKWSTPYNVGSFINSKGNQTTPSIQADKIVYYSLSDEDRKDAIGNFDIYFSYVNGTTWSTPVNLGEPVNSLYWDCQPCVSVDGNTLYFASNRPGGFGGVDIWKSEHRSDGSWDIPQNLGPSINTSYDEISPYITSDKKTLYFSSNKNNDLSGYDICFSREFEGKWSIPQKKGIPYNSDKDDFFIIIPEGKDTAILASNRAGSINGSLDLWLLAPAPKTPITPITPQVIDSTIILSGIVSEFNSKPKKYIDAELILKDLSNGKEIHRIKSNFQDGQFSINIKRGKKYSIIVQSKGYVSHNSEFEIPANASYKEYRKDIELFPLKSEKPNEKPSVRLMVFFDYDKATLRPESHTDLNNAIEFLQKNPSVFVTIAGHTDKRGSDEYNDKLSQERANSVASYIVVNGNIDVSRVKPEGFGKRKLLFEGDTEEIHQANRRVIMVLEKY